MAITPAVYRETTGEWIDDQKVFLDDQGNILWPSVILDANGIPFSTANRMPTDANLQIGNVDVGPSNRVWTQDFLTEVAKGNIPGHSLRNKFGRNPELAINTPETIWNGGGIYTGFDQTAGQRVSLASDSAEDHGDRISQGTATGGSATTLEKTGAIFITEGVDVDDILINDTKKDHGIVTARTQTTITVARFQGGTSFEADDLFRVATLSGDGAAVIKLPFLLDSNYDTHVEYVILNGLNDVTTDGTDYIRCSRGRTLGNDVNIGTITGNPETTTANIYIVLPPGENTTVISADTIPRGFTGFIVQWYAAIAEGGITGAVMFKFYVRPVNEGFTLEAEAAALTSGSTFLPESFRTPLGPIPEMSDVRIDATADSNNMAGTARWTMLLIDNNFMSS